MIRITAKATVKKENRRLFLDSALILIGESRKEQENISYGLFQDTQNPEILTFLEEWVSMSSVKTHEETNHFKDNISKLIELAESIDINLYEQLI